MNRLRCCLGLLAASALASAVKPPGVAAQDDPGDPPAADRGAAASEQRDVGLPPELARRLGQMLDRDWPEQPEWAQEMSALLQGGGMGMREGWFRPSESRYTWRWLRSEFDADEDGAVVAGELPGGPVGASGFPRLDRNGDDRLTAEDFQPGGGPEARLSRELFGRLDGDSNGRVTQEELAAFFAAADRDALGFVTVDDLQQALAAPPVPARAADAPATPRPTAVDWLRMLLTGELGSLTSGPGLDDVAPDFRLTTFDGKQKITLADYRGQKPVVLVFGSFT